MNKVIVMSVMPFDLVKILNGEKTIEIRKTFPKGSLPIDVYLCCTKKGGCIRVAGNGTFYHKKDYVSFRTERIVAKFTLKRIEKITLIERPQKKFVETELTTDTISEKELLDRSCMKRENLYDYRNYINDELIKKPKICAWYIDDLEVFEEPMELSDFYCERLRRGSIIAIYKGKTILGQRLEKVPTNWNYVWRE